jgi:opacity protein-like surface antigen
MSRYIVLSLCLLLVFSAVAVAQEPAKAEVFGGYQYFRATTGVTGIDNFNLNGWNAAVNGYINNYFGITADFSGNYGTPFGVSTKIHTFLFGPVVRYTKFSRVTPFGHALFGGVHGSAGVSSLGFGSDTVFGWAAGGGLDASVNPRFSIRLGQFDFLQSRFFSTNQNNFRYSAGVVVKF